MRLLVSLQREDWLHGPNHGVLPLPKRLTPSWRPLDLACPLHAGPPSPPMPVGPLHAGPAPHLPCLWALDTGWKGDKTPRAPARWMGVTHVTLLGSADEQG